MHSCSTFATYMNWLTRELEKADPDLSGATKPPNMTDKQWETLQGIKAQRAGHGGGANAESTSSAPDDVEARMANLADIIRKWEVNFSRHLQILLDALNHYAATETVVLLSLCARLSTANQGAEFAAAKVDESVAP